LIDDLPVLALPASLPAGDYTLVAGLYDWQTGARLAAEATGAVANATVSPDGGVRLGTIRIVN
jgi:hypothetical protein